MATLEEYDDIVCNVANAAFFRSCPNDRGRVTENLGWTQSGVSCYPCDRINEAGAVVVAQESLDRLMKDSEWLGSITGENRAASAGAILRRGKHNPAGIGHVAEIWVAQRFEGLIARYSGDDGRFIRAPDSEPLTAKSGILSSQSGANPSFYWQPTSADADSAT